MRARCYSRQGCNSGASGIFEGQCQFAPNRVKLAAATLVAGLGKKEKDALQATTTYPAIVGRLLAETRRANNLSQGEVAAMVGLSQAAWSKIERGETAATVEQIAVAADAFRLTPGQLLQQADRVVDHARGEGVKVNRVRISSSDVAVLAVIGVAALAALVAAALAGGRK